MTLRNGVKLNCSNVPVRFRLVRFIWEISPVVESSQIMEVQLQRLFRLERDQEFKEGGEEDKLFFHLSRASACVLGEEVIFNGSKASNRTRRRRKRVLF